MSTEELQRTTDNDGHAEGSTGINVVNGQGPTAARIITPNNSFTSTGYEEFFGGTMTCPTCRGSGRISRESENELVALIPVNDKRLKPRRTFLYMFLAILFCSIVAGLLLFFLLPRSINLHSDMPNLKPMTRISNTTGSGFLQITVKNVFNVSNTNFVAIRASEMNVNAFFDQRMIGQISNQTRVSIPMRSYFMYEIYMNLTFSGEEGYIAYYCDDKATHGHSLLIPFMVSAKFNYLGHEEESTLTTYQHVRCSAGVS